MRKYIPNLITLINLFCGILAILAVMRYDNIAWVAFFVALGIIFDFFDGLAARLLKVSSPLGLQLDSLADMVTSGLVPGLVMFYMLEDSSLVKDTNHFYIALIPYLGFLISLASAYRLAKFNIDTRQSDGFIGLPTPANTLVILSIPLIIIYQGIGEIILGNTWFLLIVTLLNSYLLNAEIRLFALKFKNFSFADNKVRYLFLIGSFILIILLKFIAVPIIILIYIITSLLIEKENK